jgi:hypothetical protein
MSSNAKGLESSSAVRKVRLGALVAALVVGSTLGTQNGCSGQPRDDAPDGSSSAAATGRLSQAGELAGECATNLPEQSLFDYATNCNAVIGAEVKAFNCDEGTLVPEDHLSGTYPNQLCDRPNVLRHECDPGSRFKVLHTSDDAEIVAHCRKKNGGTNYGDIAVIQYNKKNGATCFYQSPVDTSNLDPHVPAPTDPDAGKLWQQPSKTAEGQCVGCHDNGPFVRSPYLAQLRNEPVNRLPGTNEGSGPWDYRYQWNQTLPYRFLGNAFQSWKAYSVEIATNSEGRLCTNCHRMGVAEVNGTRLFGGTAQTFGPEATALTQAHKNPHSPNSPIWMLPDSVYYSATNAGHAAAVKKCAQAFANGSTAPAGCVVGRFAQGSTCTGPAISFTVNGATRGEVTAVRVETDVPLGQCSTPECAGFCYFDTIHGPFWQTSDAAIPTTDPKFRGGGLRIFAGTDSQYHLYTIASPNANTKIGIPGGSLKCMQLRELSPPPSPNSCSVNYVALSDADGRGYALSKPIAPNGQTLDILNGLIGNVAQAGADHPDLSAVQLLNGISTLNHRHSDPPSPLKIGPLRLEASSFSCQGYSPTYIVRDVYSTSDALVLAASQATKARCFISGITGAWSSTRDDGSTQPYAEIYSAGNGDIRMRVAPTTGNDNVGAYASCVRAQ